MKKISYNIFGTLFVILSILSFVFFIIIRENKIKERETSFLNKITVSSSSINFNNLTPLEKTVWNKFKKIPKNQYSFKYKEIAENNRVLLNNRSKENIGAYILREVLSSGELSPKGKLYILNKLRIFDATSGNIVNTIKLTVESLNLAEDINSEYDIIRSQIALTSIFSSLGGYDTAIKILNDINIQEKNFPEILRIKTSIYLYLAENYSFINKPHKALMYLDEIPELIKNESKDYKDNVLILKKLLTAKIYIDLNKKEDALECIQSANCLLNNLTKLYFTDLKIFYLVTSETYNLKYDKNKFSPNALKDFIKNSEYYGDLIFLKLSFKLLFQYYFETNNFEEYSKLTADYDRYLEKINTANYSVFSMYLIENLEHERFANENKKLYRNIGFLLITILIILVTAYKRIQHLDKKSKIDALTSIGNRLSFNLKLKSLNDKNYSMLLFDIDNFKNINDTYGHEFGDEVLTTVGKILKTIENKEISIYRVGGEEFTILFTHFNENFAIENCEYIRKSIENIHWKNPTTVTISGGFSTAIKNIYNECDKRLYRAKNSGKNMIIYQDIKNEGEDYDF
ncbi:MAG: GGDEF domain-containing protein [Cetobacterium sp.]